MSAITQTVVLNGRTFPRFLTSPTSNGWRIRDMRDDTFYQEVVFPNKRLCLRAAKTLNRGGTL